MRTYNHKEIQKILAKAAELEMSQSLADTSNNLTEQEIIALAEESGIKRSSIKTALLSMEIPAFENSFNWMKGTTRIQHIEYFNTPLESEQIAKVLRILQINEGELGEADLHSKTLKWNLQREIESIKVKLHENQGKTAFEYSRDWTALKFVMATFPFLIFFIITLLATKGMGFDKFTSLMIAPLGGFIGLSAGWWYLKSKFETQKQRLHKTLDELRLLFVHNDPKQNFIQMEDENVVNEQSSSKKSTIRS